MPGFESIIDQPQPVRLLQALLKKAAIPHALLFTGIDGVGKRTTALCFAMACRCLAEPMGDHTQGIAPRKETINRGWPCGQCRACRRIAAGNHPDVIQVQPKGAFIRIDEIRALCAQLALKPFEPGRRVVIISDAQAMNPEAGNALLKMLEEPPEQTILILTAQQPSDLLPTIVSRCQQIRFQPISKQGLVQLLMEKQGIAADKAEILAMLASGSYAKARKMAKGDWVAKRGWLIQAIGLDAPPGQGPKAMLPSLGYAEKLAKNRSELDDSLEILQTWLRDLAIYKVAPERIVNQDLRHQIESMAPGLDRKALLSSLGAVQTARQALGTNVNIRLTLEVMSLRLAGWL